LNEPAVHEKVSAFVQGGGIADQHTLEAIVGRTLHPKLFELIPCGSRMHVVVQAPPEFYGLISIPESIQQMEAMKTGWVAAVGPTVGTGCAYPGGPMLDRPTDILYQKIIWGDAGRPLRLDVTDNNWHSSILVMTDRDIYGFDLVPDRMAWEFQFKMEEIKDLEKKEGKEHGRFI